MAGGRRGAPSGVRRAALLVVLAAVLAAACSESNSGSTTSPTTAATTVAPDPGASTAPTATSAAANGSDGSSPATGAPARTQPQAHFGTLPPSSPLPSDADCAARVRPTPEIRDDNTSYNQTRGSGPPANPPGPLYARVTGDFTGTTDEIIQWAACKWGIDEDIVRAQVAKESYWNQDATGDFSSDTTTCAPGHQMGESKDHPDQCAESVGLMQVRYPYWAWAFPDAGTSSAYNIDVALAGRRNCFEGNDAWLNTTDRGKDYAAGDIWGCVGEWFSGRWYTQPANEYIADVQDYLSSRIWQRSDFVNYR